MTLEESYRAAEAVTKSRAKNFYFGIRLLPPRRRRSLCAVYAFFRECDDLSDDEAIDNKALRLSHWRSLIENRNPSIHPILPAFYDSVDTFGIPERYFYELLDGTTSDLTVTRYQHFDDLYDYCYKVASTVGLVCLHVFGFDESNVALQEAEARGIAFQLTNILRDVKEDAQRGRIYLPMDDLHQFGLNEDSFLRGERSESMQNFLNYQIERARAYYEKSSNLSDRVAPESRSSLEAMTLIYRTILEKVDRLGFEIFDKRASLTKMEKLSLAGRTAISGLRSASHHNS